MSLRRFRRHRHIRQRHPLLLALHTASRPARTLGQPDLRGSPPVAMPPLDVEYFIRMVKNVAKDASQEDVDKTLAHPLSITRGAVTPDRPAGTETSTAEIRPSQMSFEVQARVPMLLAMAGKDLKNDAVNEGSKVMTPRIFARLMQLMS
ncbi:hypothetical protein EDB80DRAFT_113222 [Ilyonectria destructans]|nr:hypothetical protein EDB80DRAFT_113222 [Ilyonectria destructans]